MKSVKGDADWQYNVKHGDVKLDAKNFCQLAGSRKSKIEVLKESQEAEIDRNWQDEEQPPRPCTSCDQQSSACRIANHRRESHQKAEPRIPESIEDVSRY